MALVFNVFAGLTLSLSNYSKSLNYEYESLKLESYGIETTLDLTEKYFVQLDFKRLAAQVQSSTGKLNVFGWDYTHDIGMFKIGYRLKEDYAIYISPVVYNMPILFPTQVGALTSTAAFEKTLAMGVSAGFIKQYQFKKASLSMEGSLGLLDIIASEYSQKYNYFFDLDVHPEWNLGKKIKFGVNYNLIVSQASLIEERTGSNYAFKSTTFLQNLFLTFAYTLR